MTKLFSLLIILTLSLVLPTSPANALSCITQTMADQFEESTYAAIIKTSTLRSTNASQSISTTFTWDANLQQVFKGDLSLDLIVRDIVWSGGAEASSRLVAGKEYLVFLNKDMELGMCNYPRNIDDQPLTNNERELLNGYIGKLPGCEPYECKDGSTYAACGSDGQPLNFFAPPCHANGGEISNDTNGFTDVPQSHPQYNAIEWAQKKEIISGYEDGSFRPDNTINRAEFVKILTTYTFTSRAFFYCDPNSIYNFTDASKNEWYSKSLCLAVQHQLVAGDPGGTFRPSSNINFAEAAKIITKLHSKSELIPIGTDWYEVYIQYLQSNNAIPINANPSYYITRGDMVEILYKLLSTTDDSTINSVPNNQSDCILAGGTWHQAGLLTVICSIPTKDADKICSDNSECDAGCIYINSLPKEMSNANIQGVCKSFKTSSPTGCWTYIEKGTVQPVTCFD